MVVVFPAPLCPRKETTWFSWRLRLSLSRASLLPVLYTLVSLSIHTTNGRWLGSSSMPRISSGVGGEMRKGEISGVVSLKYKNKSLTHYDFRFSFNSTLSYLIILWSLTCLHTHTHILFRMVKRVIRHRA